LHLPEEVGLRAPKEMHIGAEAITIGVAAAAVALQSFQWPACAATILLSQMFLVVSLQLLVAAAAVAELVMEMAYMRIIVAEMPVVREAQETQS